MIHKTPHFRLLILTLLTNVIVFGSLLSSDSHFFSQTTQAAAIAGSGSGLVAYYTFDDGTANDQSGNGNNGSITSGSSVAGKILQALGLNGSNAYVSVPNSSSFNFSNTNFTIAAWINIGPKINQTIWGSSDVFSNIELSLIDQGGYNLGLWNGSEWQYSSASLSTGWHHVAVVRTGPTTISWYVDGSPAGTNTFTVGTWANGTQPRWIGDGFRGNFNGSIDELRLYNRTLDPGEITELYNYTGGGSASSAYTLTVSKVGGGSGTVSGGGISCGSTCSQPSISSGTAITLIASAAPGSIFNGWSDACSGTDICTVNLTADTTVTASFLISSGPVDGQAPTIPSGLNGSALSSTQINLSWNASTDNTAVTGYKVFRNGTQIATPTGTTYQDSGLTANTSYSYTVAAFDATNNTSSQSSAVNVTTQAAAQPTGPIKKVGGPNSQYSTIGACIAAAVTDDVCEVYQGTYNENVTINKAITVRNVSGTRPIISASSGVTVSFSANNSSLIGFEVIGTAASTNVISGLSVQGVTVQDNKIHGGSSDNVAGVYFRNSKKILVDNNEIYGNKDGVRTISCNSLDGTYANGCVFTNNKVHNNGEDGFKVHGKYITIDRNEIYDNILTDWAAVHPDGIQLNAGTADSMTSVQNAIISNNLIRNQTQNIFTEGSTSGANDCTDIAIFNNVIYNSSGTVNGVNMDAIAIKNMMIKYSNRVYIYNNYSGRHAGVGIYVQGGGANSIYIKNNIMTNTLPEISLWVDTTNVIPAGGINNNLYYPNPGQTNGVVRWGGTYYPTAAAFNTGVSSMETTKITGNPFVAALPNPTLTSNSTLAINAGADLTNEISKPSLAGFILSSGATINNLTKDKNGSNRPSGNKWDIGPYEDGTSGGGGTPTPIIGDFDGDGAVTTLDVSAMLIWWNKSNATYDLNRDNIVNTLDFTILVRNWTN